MSGLHCKPKANMKMEPMPPSFAELEIARSRLSGVTRVTRLISFACQDPRIELRLKLECEQETGAFKARGAWNHVAALRAQTSSVDSGKPLGVVTASSGNHGKALAWAAQRAGLAATVCMPFNAYSSKIDACRALGADVFLAPDRAAAEARALELESEGWYLAPPYDHARTIAGQASVALEVVEQWPDVEVFVVPVGGGGLLAGTTLVAAERGQRVLGVEPQGAAGMSRALELGHATPLPEITSTIQGLTPPGAGRLTHRIARDAGVSMRTLDDAAILAAQARLVRELGLTVEPAGAATTALMLARGLPAAWLEGRSASQPLRVAAIVSGGNPDPQQIAQIRAAR